MLAAIAIGSLLPGFGPTDRYDFDKFVHLGAYMALAFWPMLVLRGRAAPFLLLIALLAASALVEWLQGAIPGREASYVDFAANAAGLLTGSLAARLLRRQAQVLAFLQR